MQDLVSKFQDEQIALFNHSFYLISSTLFRCQYHAFFFITYTSAKDCRGSTSDITQNYIGTWQTTRSGKTCQRWDSQTPHNPSSTYVQASQFPDASISDAANYCRNIVNGDSSPWCYTMDPNERWEYCDIPLCSSKFQNLSFE